MRCPFLILLISLGMAQLRLPSPEALGHPHTERELIGPVGVVVENGCHEKGERFVYRTVNCQFTDGHARLVDRLDLTNEAASLVDLVTVAQPVTDDDPVEPPDIDEFAGKAQGKTNGTDHLTILEEVKAGDNPQ